MSSNGFPTVIGSPTAFHAVQQPDGTYVIELTVPTDMGEVDVLEARVYVEWKFKDGHFLITGIEECEKGCGANGFSH